MSQTILHNDFSAGWVPSDNYINGRRNGLLQMDNFCLDDNGALTSVKGPTALSLALAGKAHTLFSATISGTQKQLAAIDTGACLEGSTFTNSLFTGGSASRAAFANVLDQILICSGTQNKKWDGTTVRNAGITAPGGAPTVAENASVELSVANLTAVTHLFTNWSMIDGIVGSDTAFAYKVTPSAVNNLGQITTTYAAILDTSVFPNGSPMTDADVFSLPMKFSNGSQVLGVQVTLYPDDGAGGLDIGNAFIHTFDNSNTAWPIGSDATILLQCYRLNFNVNDGDYPPRDKWASIRGVRIYYYANATIDFTFGDMKFTGSTTAILSGSYEYLQVNVYSTGKYLAQSAVSAIAKANPFVASVHVTPYITAIDPQVNQVWIFRRNVNTEGSYFRVKVTTSPFAAFDDVVTDTDAELLGITANLFLSTLSVLTTGIKAIIGLWFERVLYYDDKNIYFSDRLNADSIDSRKTVTYSGNTSEVFLWALKVTNSVILVATDLDIYELSGTFNELPDGTLDISFRPLAVKNPPVSIAAVAYSSSVIYQAADGWRILDGINSTSLSENFDVLFKNTGKYGYAAITDGYFAGQLFSNCAIANNKLYTTQKDTDGIYRCFVYDLSRKYWYVYTNGLYALAVKEDGSLIGSSFVDSKIYSLDLDAGNDTLAQALFIVETNNEPRNRKDSYTFKCRVNTGGDDLKIYIYKDLAEFGTTPILIGTINNSVLAEVIIDISSLVGICKAYQVQLVGTFDSLIFADYSIDFDSRPTQLTHLTKTAENYGTSTFKQIPRIPLIIDTLGNDVSIIPTIDDVVYPAQIINTTRKETVYLYFTADTECLEIGFELSGILFEFYSWLQPAFIEVRPQRVKYIQRVADNFGIASIKQLSVLPFVINTLGNDVTCRAILDGVLQAAQIFNTTYKKTCFYVFNDDTIAIDIGGTLSGTLFEFYEWLKPEVVQVFQVTRSFDSIGPIEFTKNARLLAVRFRVFPLGTSLTLNVLANEVIVYTTNIACVALKQLVYESIVPRGVNGTVFEFQLISGDGLLFSRMSFEYKAIITGGQTDNRWRQA